MPYTYVLEETAGSPSGARGKILPSPILFSEIFDGVPQFYSGSTINCQEILTIECNIRIGEERFVDADFRWFDPKVYFGTYQFGDLISGLQSEQELGQGFLTNRKHFFVRRSSYEIIANPDTPFGFEEVFVVDNCGFETSEIGIEFGGASLTVQRPLRNEALFQGKISKTRAPLKDATYNQFFGQIGLYLNPGCELIRITHRVQIINNIQADFLPYPEFTCSLAGESPAP